MKLYCIPIAAMFLLAGCGGGNEETAPPPPQSAIEAPPDIPVMGEEISILAIGDSLLTGYGLKDGESYPAILENALRARGINARIANAGVSGDTTAGGLRRLKFTLDAQTSPPALVLISLGGNDMLRGQPPEQTSENLDAMLAQLSERNIPVVLLGMLSAPNLGQDFASKFNTIYPTLAKKHGATLVPFFLQPVMDRPELVQDDHVHPTAKGIEAMVAASVETIAEAVKERD